MTSSAMCSMKNITQVIYDTSGALIISGGAVIKKDLYVSRSIRKWYQSIIFYLVIRV